MSDRVRPSPILDHIVILVSHDILLDLDNRVQRLFNLMPGGTHEDGMTSNKLILFSDGVYIEFIAFYADVDPERRRKHRWGNLKEGTIIDWAFTLPPDGDFRPLSGRVLDANVGISYEDPVPGGRKREDGTTLKWTVSTAKNALGNAIPPGYLPFWCLDKTPRDLRVPYSVEPHLTQHQTGVRGISALLLSVPRKEIPSLTKAYDVICGPAPEDQVWHYEVPSGSTAGRNTISISGTEGDAAITLVLNGLNCGQVEILPGIIFKVE
ncbi:hypothetical protein SI65_08255 [Aspergillus cristatus]|uniref:Glyoxalase-like domain-containing protein n=1 Tax=Aspergillus cristatus TaxID=573508 RepID=A0A1E3B768_ASPCR|nr:hypothetical protein SI65_08255 [Aspergillus cristatus]